MSSDKVIKCVAKKLRYYFEVKRLEDGFDLSGTNAPALSHPRLKPRSTLQYDGLHDKPVKHFFSSPEIRAHITHMDKKFSTQLEREKTIRTLVEHYLSQYRFHPSNLPDYAYIRSRRGKKLRNEGIGFGASPPSNKHKRLKGGVPQLRCKPPHYISKGEAERLINVATKLLAATESSDNGKTVQSNSSSTKSSLPDIDRQKQTPEAPPYVRPKTARGRAGPSEMYVYSSTGRRVLAPQLNNYSDSLDSAYMTQRMSSGSNDWKRQKRLQQQQQESSRNQWSPPRTHSRSETVSDSISDTEGRSQRDGGDDPCKESAPREVRLPPSAVINDIPPPEYARVTVLGSTQRTESVAIQTENKLLDSYDYMEEIVGEGPECEYHVYVRTGTRIGASTKAEVKVTLYGEHGRTQELLLAESKRHKIKFQKGKEDLFILSTPHLGKLRKIKIGHDHADIAYGWFLEGVSIHDLTDKRIYEFVCERWLSGQDTDRQTYRELLLDSDRAMIEDNESMTGSTFSLSQPEQKADERVEDTVSNDGVSMLAKHSKDGYSSGSDTDSESDSDSSTVSDDSQKDKTTKKDKKEKKEKAIVKVESNIEDKSRDSEDFFDVPPAGPVFTFRTGSSDADTEKPEMSESGDGPMSTTTSDPSEVIERPAVQYLEGYKAGIEAAQIREEKLKESMEQNKKQILKGESIHDAARSGNLRRVKELTHYYPDMAASRDGSGWNPLHIASSEGHVDVVKWLLASNVGINDETPTGYTAVHVAAMNGHVSMLMILCAMGANVNSESVDRQTPLHLAAKNGRLESVKWLIANRADILAADSFGRVAVNLSEEYEQTEVTEFLQSCEAELSDVNSNLARIRNGHKSMSEVTTAGSLPIDHRQHKVHFDWNMIDKKDENHINSVPQKVKADTENLKDKRVMYDEQQTKMKASGDSFLDSIRQEFD